MGGDQADRALSDLTAELARLAFEYRDLARGAATKSGRHRQDDARRLALDLDRIFGSAYHTALWIARDAELACALHHAWYDAIVLALAGSDAVADSELHGALIDALNCGDYGCIRDAQDTYGSEPGDAIWIAEVLESATASVNRGIQSPQSTSDSAAPNRRLGVHVLQYLAFLLPAEERSRFVAEAQGNLGGCDHWWQRVDHLVGLALGTPRLAWMMRREGRRGRV